MTDKNRFLLSVVVPVFNEEKNITAFLQRIKPILDKYDYEMIFIDDGSTDNTLQLLKTAVNKNSQIKIIAFYRNFGHQTALSCGYQHAKGDCVISLDVDLQDPPEILPEMIAKWQSGAKVVYAQRSTRVVDSFFKRQTAAGFYKFINFLSDTPIPNDVGDFRLLDREVIDFLNQLPESSRFLRGLVAWGNYPAAYVYFKREKRYAGKTNYTFSKMLNFALDGIISFSTKPLKIATYFGFFSAALGFLGIIYAIIGKIFLPSYWVTGWTGLFVGIMFLGGIQLITIGIIGEYVGRIYKEVQNRPPYLVKEKINL